MLRRTISDRKIIICGILILLGSFLPYLLLHSDSVILVGDQLDGEIFTYLYGAEYLFSGQHRIAEYMGGIPREALFPASVFTMLFYKILPPLAAFLANLFFVSAAAFSGMYVLLEKLECKKLVAFVTALIFAFLPFYSVYGLSIAGIPLVAWSFLKLKEDAETIVEGKRPRKGREAELLRPVLFLLLYVVSSSFVLIGYAVIGLAVLYCLILLCSRKRRYYIGVYGAAFCMTVLYLLMNKELVGQVLGFGTTLVSHKTEYVLHGQPFFQSMTDLFLRGAGHAPSCHGFLILPVLAMIVTGAFLYRGWERTSRLQYRILTGCFAAAAGIAVFYGIFHTQYVAQLRQRLGGFFVYFQIDRIYWFYPVLWYVMLAMLVSLLGELGDGQGRQVSRPLREKNHFQKYHFHVNGWKAVQLFLLLFSAAVVLWRSDFKKNVRQLLLSDTSNAVTWEKYYGPEIFEEIEDYIGKEKSSYRVASVGLNPAVAAFNGFYTVDGYSNNYELSYKQSFRRVIEGELLKDETLRRYFDDWGNRCYLFCAQLGTETYFEKDSGVSIRELSVNTEQLKALGCTYVFAGVPVENATALGWTLEKEFEAVQSDCRYRIRLYRLPE